MALTEFISVYFEELSVQPFLMITSFLGTIVILFCAFRLGINLAKGIRLYFIAQLKCFQVDITQRYGQWAVVTGATDGIGLAFAKELASRGMSVLVISRSLEKLAKTKTMLEAIPNVGAVETIQSDMSDSSMENFDKIRRQIDPNSRDIGILVNNVGHWGMVAQRFNRFETEFLIKMGELNMLSMVHMTRMIMPGMLERQRGLLINISSMCCYCDFPYLGIYKPTKSFVAEFSRQLQHEYASYPIDIVLLTTGPVKTRGAQIEPGSAMRYIVAEPDDYARSAMNAATTGCSEFSGTITHGLLIQLLCFFNYIGILHLLIRLAPKFIPSPPGNFSPNIRRRVNK